MLIAILGTLLSLAYLYCSVTQRSALWLLGFVSSALYIVVYFQSKFYADMTLQVYYLVVSVYGWWHWKRGRQVRSTQAELPVTRTPGRTWAGVAAVAVVGLIEWVKNFVEKFLAVPGWVWSVVVLLASIGCGFLAVYGADVTAHNPLMAVLLGLAILALAQIGYDGLKTAIMKRAEKALGVGSEKAD